MQLQIIKDDIISREISPILLNLDFQSFAYILFGCKEEEESEYGGSTYNIPGYGDVSVIGTVKIN